VTLLSRTFTRQDNPEELLKYVERVFAEELRAGDLELEVAVKAGARPRKDRVASALPADAVDWAEDGYEFSFSKRRYSWNGLRLHVTAGEALFLYRWLIQGSYNASEKYYLHNLRKRYGPEFLAEKNRRKG
jgi:hypothetical protein